MITIKGDSVQQIFQQLGQQKNLPKIGITWRYNALDYGRGNELGCIVNAVGIADDLVPLEFPNIEDAINYIRTLLQDHDQYVMIQKEKNDKG